MDIYFGNLATQLTEYNAIKNSNKKEIKKLNRQKYNYQILLDNLLASYNIYKAKFEEYGLYEDLDNAIKNNEFNRLLIKIEGSDNGKYAKIFYGFAALWLRYYHLVNGYAYESNKVSKIRTYKSLFYDDQYNNIKTAILNYDESFSTDSLMFAYIFDTKTIEDENDQIVKNNINTIGINNIDGFKELYNFNNYEEGKIYSWLRKIVSYVNNDNMATITYSNFYNANNNEQSIIKDYKYNVINDFEQYDTDYQRFTNDEKKKLNDLLDLYSIIYNLLLTKSIGNSYNNLTTTIENIDNEINDLTRDNQGIDRAIERIINLDKEPDMIVYPKNKSLEYNGEEQELITPGRAVNGDVYYRLGINGTWNIDIPTAVNSTHYDIYYKIVPYDENKPDINFDEHLTSEIRKTNPTIIIPEVSNNLVYNTLPQSLIQEGTGLINGDSRYIKYNITRVESGESINDTSTDGAGTYHIDWYIDDSNLDIFNYNFTDEMLAQSGELTCTIAKADPNIEVSIGIISVGAPVIPNISSSNINSGDYYVEVAYISANVIGDNYTVVYSTNESNYVNQTINNTGNYIARITITPKNLNNYNIYQTTIPFRVVNNINITYNDYYWYIGPENPSNIDDALSDNNKNSAGWRRIGETLPGPNSVIYDATIESNNISWNSLSSYYLILPTKAFKVIDNANGDTTDGFTYRGSKTFNNNNNIYYIYQRQGVTKGFTYKIVITDGNDESDDYLAYIGDIV